MTGATRATGSDRIEHAVGSQGRFSLRLPGGEVEVRGVDGETVRVVDRDGRALDERFQVDRTDGALSLSIRDGSLLGSIFGVRDRASAKLAIDVPRGATVTIETVSAEVEVVDHHGPAQYRTTSGEIALQHVSGPIEINSVSGDIDLDASGPVDLRAQTVSGDVELRAPALTRLELATTSGDVRVDARLVGPGPFSIHTVSGDAEVVGRTGLSIDAKTITGDLSTELPHRSESRPGRRSLVVGGGEASLNFQSVSGDLEVTRPRDELPETERLPGSAIQAPPATVDGGEEGRLAVLRALERGEISIDAAAARLAALDEA